MGLEGFIPPKRRDLMDVGKEFHDESAYFHQQLIEKNDFYDVADDEIFTYFASLLRKKVDETPFMYNFLVAENDRLLQLREDEREDIFLPLFIEQKFKSDELDIMGYFDRLYETYDGEYCVQEIKPLVTSSNISKYRQELFFWSTQSDRCD